MATGFFDLLSFALGWKAAAASATPAPYGRMPTAVNQPPSGGSLYPFVAPSTDILYLLSDFYLSYDDPTCQFELPFSIDWLYGFGDNVVAAPSGTPTPVNAHELRVVDANGETVFDSTTADNYATKAWDSRLLIIEWIADDAVCRCVMHTAWEQEDIDAGLSMTYDLHIQPTNGELNARTLNRAPDRVRSIKVGSVTLDPGKVEIVSGYNMDIAELTAAEQYTDIAEMAVDLEEFVGLTSKPVKTGTRAVSRIGFDAEAGNGLGRYPGCEEITPTLKEINGVRPNDAGDFTFDIGGCLRSQRPIEIVKQIPRKARVRADSLTDEQAASALEMHNDCLPCCDCDYYVRTYAGLKRQWNLHSDIADQMKDARTLFQEIVARWNAEKSCRETNPIRTILMSESGCKAGGGASFCNNNECCAIPVVLRLTFLVNEGTVPVSEGGDCLQSLINGTQFEEEEAYTLAGTWPVLEAYYDYIDPQDSASLSFRVKVPGCTEATTVQFYASIHYPDSMENPDDESCTPATEAEVPAAVTAIWAASDLGLPAYTTRAIKASRIVPLNPTSAYCRACN